MGQKLPLEEHSIYDIYFGSDERITYTIPVYQRNYAWEEDEITALIKDVFDSFRKDRHSLYYIGTLVSYNRGNNTYEIIDGQQRLTTIYIILKAIGIKRIQNKLTYTARKASAETIERLDDYPAITNDADNGIIDGYRYAYKAIDSIVNQNDRKDFETYFLHNVHIIHYQVPKDVDLNHYFEVMNSRGEQLEKHEIVKSFLSQPLKGGADLAAFSRVWEACSEMNMYIQQAFPSFEIFGNYLNRFMIEDFREIPAQEQHAGKTTIKELMRNSALKLENKVSKDQEDRFQPIIDFPNFLLIVLKLTRMSEPDFNPQDFILDDKELLNEFDKAIKACDDKAGFARKFAYNLLKAKYMLDNLIVHHIQGDKEQSGDNPWKLQYLYQETKKKKYPKNLSSDLDRNKELVHLLSMFEVSFTPKQRKNYLFYCLMYLFERKDAGGDSRTEQYLEFLRRLADKYFYDVYLDESRLNERSQPLPNAFDNVMLSDGRLQTDLIRADGKDYRKAFTDIYRQGKADIPLFIFNYTDYKIWRKYASQVRGEKLKKGSAERNAFFASLGCSDFELDPFNNFYFSRTRKSLEHYYPHAKAVMDDAADGVALTQTQINCFGNFAMISAQANSSGSNWDPVTKLDHYIDGKSDPVGIASLKFRIMMQKCRDNQKDMLNEEKRRPRGMEWNFEDILSHQARMLEIIIE